MKELVGKTIYKIWLENSQQDYIMFETDQGLIGYEAWGDCCSESWFADIVGVDALLLGTVIEAEEIELPEHLRYPDDGRTRQECDEAYGYKIKTGKGYADIIYRNSSNGYYGGWLSKAEFGWPENTKWRTYSFSEIVDDYSA